MGIRESIYKALENVKDPELNKSLTELGMVEDVKVEGQTAQVKIALTTKGCPMKNKIKEDIIEAAKKIAGIDNVEVIFGEMSPERKKKLLTSLKPQKFAQIFKNTNIIVIGSGKGGVGKSTVTANLAFAFNNLGFSTGILDADVYGFSIPRLVGLEGKRATGRNKRILPLEREGVKMISVGSFIDDADGPIIWRAPMLMGVLKQFIEDVEWGELDYLLVDLPPGTGDAPLNIMQMLPDSGLLIVTTPQASASHVAGRIGFMASEVNIPTLGIIENMSFFICPECGREYKIFGKGETDELAECLNVPVIGRIPLIPEIRERSDEGNPVTLFGGPGEKVLKDIARVIADRVVSVKS